jgi:diguanylate cyclase (GGDEF)-like protein
MDDWCTAAVRAHKRDPSAAFGMVMFDLDLFRQLNDTYGRLAGDAVLKQIGEIVRGTIRGEDLAVRFGGEELAVFVHCPFQVGAGAVAERIRRRVETAEFQSEAGRMLVTLSGGVAYHTVDQPIDDLIAKAETKLHEAKEGGRNRICL